MPESEQRFKHMADTAPAMLWITEADGYCSFLSRGWYEYTGQTEDHALGFGWLDAVHPDDQERSSRIFRNANEKSESFVLDYRLRRADGEYRWAIDAGRPRLNSEGKFQGFIGSVIDVHERKQAEEKLKRSTAIIEGITASTEELIAAQDAEYRYIYFNEAYRSTFESLWGKELRLGASMLDLLADWPQELEKASTLWRRAHQGESFSVAMEFGPNSEKRIFDLRFNPLHDGSGSQFGAAHMLRDVTEQVQTQEALRESQQQLSAIFNQTTVGIARTDLTGRFTLVNSYYCQMVGRTAEELYALRMQDITHPDDLSTSENLFNKMVGDGTPFAIEKRYLRPDGSHVWVRNQVSAISDKQGHTIAVLAGSVDITERKHTEEELRRSEDRFRRLVEGAPFGMYIVDSQFHIAHMNARSQVGAFRNVQPVIGRPLAEALSVLWPERVVNTILSAFKQTITTGEPYYSRDFVHARADLGTTEGYEWELQRIQLSDGQYGVVCYYFDSSELRRAQAALREADRRKDEFLATLAHELRNPLAPIRTGLEVLKLREEGTEETQEVRSMMQRQTDQLVHLIDDLLDLSRITRGTIELRKRNVPLENVIRSAVEACQGVIEDAEHQLTLTLPDHSATVNADPHRLTQVISNLLNNAAKYTEAGGRIWLTAEVEGDVLLLVVRDTGIGIPVEMQESVFEMFTQVKGRNTDSGLGIGLTLVRSLVELHDGRIELCSAGTGTGTTFTLRLPIVVDEEPDEVSAESLIEGALQGLRVLVVDDTRAGVFMLRKVLESHGCEIREAYDGQEAIDVATEFQPDAIVMDIGMPVMDGHEAARRIRMESWGKRIKMIALTGWGQEDDKRRTQDAGFDHHLVKPPDPDLLRKLLAAR